MLRGCGRRGVGQGGCPVWCGELWALLWCSGTAGVERGVKTGVKSGVKRGVGEEGCGRWPSAAAAGTGRWHGLRLVATWPALLRAGGTEWVLGFMVGWLGLLRCTTARRTLPNVRCDVGYGRQVHVYHRHGVRAVTTQLEIECRQFTLGWRLSIGEPLVQNGCVVSGVMWLQRLVVWGWEHLMSVTRSGISPSFHN